MFGSKFQQSSRCVYPDDDDEIRPNFRSNASTHEIRMQLW